MRQISVDLTADERDLLVRIVEQSLPEERTKHRHSRLSSKAREEFQAEQGILREILDKLVQAHAKLGV